MKWVFFVIFSIVTLSKSFSIKFQNDSLTHKLTLKSSIVNDNQKLILDFRKLRDEIYRKNIDSLNQRFSFPLNNINKEALWYLSLAGYNDKLYGINRNRSFCEKDFVNYFDRIFSKEFIQCLLKIKSNKLFENGSVTSPFFYQKENDGLFIKYWIDAQYDKTSKILKLQLCNFEYDSTQNSKKVGESVIEFQFKLNGDCRFLFLKLILVG